MVRSPKEERRRGVVTYTTITPPVLHTERPHNRTRGLRATSPKGLGRCLGRVGVCVCVYFISHILSHAGETLPVFQTYVFGSFLDLDP